MVVNGVIVVFPRINILSIRVKNEWATFLLNAAGNRVIKSSAAVSFQVQASEEIRTRPSYKYS